MPEDSDLHTAKSPRPAKPMVVVQPTILPGEPPILINTNERENAPVPDSDTLRSVAEIQESSERHNLGGPSGPMFGGFGMPGMPPMPAMRGMPGMPPMPGPSGIQMPAFGIPNMPIPEIPGMPGLASRLQARMDDVQARYRQAQSLLDQLGRGPQQAPGHAQRGEDSSDDSLSSSSNSSSSWPSSNSSDQTWPGAGTPAGAFPTPTNRRLRNAAIPARRGGRHDPPAPPRD